jgi:hypothetical protein
MTRNLELIDADRKLKLAEASSSAAREEAAAAAARAARLAEQLEAALRAAHEAVADSQRSGSGTPEAFSDRVRDAARRGRAGADGSAALDVDEAQLAAELETYEAMRSVRQHLEGMHEHEVAVTRCEVVGGTWWSPGWLFEFRSGQWVKGYQRRAGE